MSNSGEFLSGGSKSGGGSAPAYNAKSGEARSGQFKSGDAGNQALVIADTAMDVHLTTPTPTVTGAGTAPIADGAMDVHLATPTAVVRQILRIADGAMDVALATPTGDITGAGTVTVADDTTVINVALGQEQVGYPEWVVAGESLRVTGATLTPTALTLDIRARDATERATLDALDTNAGSLDQRERADGTIAGLDTAGGGNTVTAIPPVSLQPERVTRDWLVDSVSRRRTSASTEATLATLELAAKDTRDAVTTLSETAAANSWTFDFSAGGRIVTDRVHEIEQGETTRVDLILEPAQAELFETVTAATAGAIVRTVPDGETFSEDTTPTSRQTVTVDPPDDAADPALPADTYVVTGWRSEGSDGGKYRVSMDLSTRYEAQ